MGQLTAVVLALLGGLLASFLNRDLYACAGQLERAILKLASLLVSKKDREEVFHQWWGDLSALPKSELLRLLFALDCVRGGAIMGAKFVFEERNQLREVSEGPKRTETSRYSKIRKVVYQIKMVEQEQQEPLLEPRLQMQLAKTEAEIERLQAEIKRMGRSKPPKLTLPLRTPDAEPTDEPTWDEGYEADRESFSYCDDDDFDENGEWRGNIMLLE